MIYSFPEKGPGIAVGLFDGITGKEEIVDLPPGVVRYRCRHRRDAFSRIFLRFADRIEERSLVLTESGALRPDDLVLAVNIFRS